MSFCVQAMSAASSAVATPIQATVSPTPGTVA